MRHFAIAALAAALLLGCTPDRPKLPSLPAAFATLPLPPEPEFLGQTGSEDALMFTFRSARKADVVAETYRQLFASDTAYHTVSTNTGAQGEHAFYVEFRGRPLWVRVRPEAGNEGSIVELTGAVVATADTDHPAPADTLRPRP
ncbi:MAG: hypothetical protein ABJB33_01290 [Gemmatimonadota bacterium]